MEDFQYSTTPSSQFVQQSVFRSSSNQQPQAYNNSSLSAFCSTDSTSSQQSFSNASSIHQHQYAAVNSADSSNDIKPGTLLLRNINNNSNNNVSNFDLSDHQAGRNTISSSYPPLSLTYANNSAAGSNAKANNSAQRAKTNAPRTHDHISPLVVCATRMDRLSPYGNYDDSRNGANLAGLSLDQIFKTNTNDDSDRNDSVGRGGGGGGGGGGQTNNDAILLLNQNIECLKQAYANGNQNSNGSLGPSSSPTTSTISNMSNLDVNNQLSSPPTSTSPSSSTDTPSTYGTLTNTILNGALTPPPDNSANSLTSDSVVSSSVYNPYSVKGVQLQHSHHHHHQSQLASLKLSLNGGNGANLVNLVPSNNNNNNNNPNANNSANNLMANLGTHLGNSTSASHSTAQMLQQQTNAVNSNNNGMGSGMMSILQPSKPLNISELSNCSLMSSTSSSGSSTLDTPGGGGGSNGTSKRARGSKSNDGGDQKDGKYFERRKRNNVAAKKSRDARKQREDEIAIRASFLEKENSILKAQLQTLKDEAQQLRILLAQKKSSTASLASTSSCSNCSNCSAMVAAAAAAVNGVNGGLVGVGGPIGGCHNNNNNNGNNKPSQQGNGLVNGMMSHGGYASSNLNNLAAQLNSYEHSDLVDKQQQVVLNSASQAASAANASIYLQHQNQHRHSII